MEASVEFAITHPNEEKILISTVATMLAAAIVISSFYPIECIEAKMQLGQIEKKSIFRVLRTTSLSSHYLGCLSSVLGHIFAWGTYIFISSTLKLSLSFSDENLTLFLSCNLHLDAIGAFFYITIYTPFSTTKIRLITEPQHQGSMKHYLLALIENKKIRELYSGYCVGLMYVCEGIIQLGIYEELKKTRETYFHYFLIGVVAKFLAISLTYPYRVVVSVLQSRPIGVAHTLKMIVKSSGISGFYKGYGACLLRQLPPAGFLFMILEGFKYVLVEMEEYFWKCLWLKYFS